VDLALLTEGLPIRLLAGPPSVRITDLTEDSRSVMPGSLFVARRGEKSDGHAYIPQALAAGAAAILCEDPRTTLPRSGPAPGAGSGAGSGATLLHAPNVPLAQALLAERFFGSPSSKLTLCGVTGTNGKTTITFLIHQLLNNYKPHIHAPGHVVTQPLRCGLIGTVCIDDGTEVAPSQLTTPPAMELSRTFARMVEAGCRTCAMETSSHALDQHRVSALKYRVAIYSNLSHDHLDYHQTMDRYAAAKARLFEMLPPGSPADGSPRSVSSSTGGVAIVNADDPWAPRMVRDCRARVLWCSQRSGAANADIRAITIHATTRATTIDVTAPWTDDCPGGTARLTVPLVGAHNVMNAIQAATAAWAMGLPAPDLRAGLSNVAAPAGRLEPITPPDAPFAVYVDYAHSDDSLQRVIATLREPIDRLPPERRGRLIVLFGCGGDRDRAKRPKMGAVATAGAEAVIITSDNPRTEHPQAIIDDILAGIPPAARSATTVEPDRARAIHLAISMARTGDVILIAGKGHEDYQILPDPTSTTGTRKVHFDDREIGRAALADRTSRMG
jgi:UDP-N-acetylmuramoyl-L-alanyl-D-glutamate--2,6-diaminopimelate ligase